MEYLSSFRIAAKIASIFDLVISALCALLSFTVLLAMVKEKRPEEEDSNTPTNNHYRILGIAFTILFSVYTLLHIWASTRLFRAAAKDADPAFALRGTKIWQCFNLFFILLVIAACIYRPTSARLYVVLVLRFMFLFVVLLFMRDLNEATNQ